MGTSLAYLELKWLTSAELLTSAESTYRPQIFAKSHHFCAANMKKQDKTPITMTSALHFDAQNNSDGEEREARIALDILRQSYC